MDKRNLFTETLTAQKMRDRLETKLLSLRKKEEQRQEFQLSLITYTN